VGHSTNTVFSRRKKVKATAFFSAAFVAYRHIFFQSARVGERNSRFS
jgi:hypothetical protein